MEVEYKRPEKPIEFKKYEFLKGPILLPKKDISIEEFQERIFYTADVFHEYLKDFSISVKGIAEIEFRKIQYVRTMESENFLLLTPYVKINTDYGFSRLYLYPSVHSNLMNILDVDGGGIAEKTAIKCFSSVEKSLGNTKMVFNIDGKRVLPACYDQLPDVIKEFIQTKDFSL